MIDIRPVRFSVPTPEVVIRLSGEIDLGNEAAVAARLDGVAVAAAGDVVVDLSQVTFMGCAGLRPLLGAQRELGERLWLRAPSRPVLRLLQLTGLLADFQVVSDDAMAERTSGPEVPWLVARGERTSEALTTIEQARGLLMGVHGCDATQAQQLLDQASGRGRLSVGAVAAALTSLSALVADRTQGAALSAVLRSLLPAPHNASRAGSAHRAGARMHPG